MNSMELVRFPSRPTRRPNTAGKISQPPFAADLVGPVRTAIVRARQWFVLQQRSDGSWLGRQSSEVSLASQLIFVLAIRDEENSELAHRCAATILSQQMLDGGWSVDPGGIADVSVSVQAYFALKLTGHDPVDEQMAAARRRIRELGGADATDALTRFYLALLGQLSHDDCGSIRFGRELLSETAASQRTCVSMRWAGHPVRKVPIERGVRELFTAKPADWPTLIVNGSEVPLAAIEEIGRRETSELSFHELVCRIIAIRSNERSTDEQELGTFEDALAQLVDIDEETGFAHPRSRSVARVDSAEALGALIESGMSRNHPAIQEGIDILCTIATSNEARPTVEACRLIASLALWGNVERSTGGALPPDIDVRWDWHYTESPAEEMPDWRRDSVDRAINDCLKHILLAQNADGGWSASENACQAMSPSDPDLTGIVLKSLNGPIQQNVAPARKLARRCLGTQQCADGRWEHADGALQIRSTAAAICGLVASGTEPDDDCILAGLNWLAVQQQPNGSWDNSALPTAEAIIGLVAGGKCEHPAVRRGIQFLLQSQDSDGSWTERRTAFDADTNRGGDLHCSCRCLSALSQFAIAADSSKIARAGDPSLQLIAASAEN